MCCSPRKAPAGWQGLFYWYTAKYSMQVLIETDTTTLPITLASVKAHLRVEDSADDTLITNLIWAATDTLEHLTDLDLRAKTWHLMLPAFPRGNTVYLRRDLTLLNFIKYYDGTNTLRTLDDAEYYAFSPEGTPAWVAPVTYWPITYTRPDAVQISYDAGLPPGPLARQAILLLVGAWYDSREDIITGTIVSELPMGVKALAKLMGYEGVK